MADAVADEVDDVVMRRDEGGLDGERSCYAMGCCSGHHVASMLLFAVAMIFEICVGAPMGGVLAGTFAGRKNLPGSRSSHGSFFDVR